MFFFFFFSFIFVSWRLITLQYCSAFCHTLTWISHGSTCIPRPDLPSHLPLYPIPLGLPSAPGPSTCLMHPTWASIPLCFFFFLKSTTFSFTRVDLSLYWCSFSRLQMFETKLSCFLFQMSSPVSLGETEFDSFIPEILSWKYLKGKDKMK